MANLQYNIVISTIAMLTLKCVHFIAISLLNNYRMLIWTWLLGVFYGRVVNRSRILHLLSFLIIIIIFFKEGTFCYKMPSKKKLLPTWNEMLQLLFEY